MATFLYRLGRLSARRRGIVVATWAVLLACLAGAAATFSVPVTGAITIPGTESQDALDSLARQFPQASGPTGTIVLAAAEGEQLTGPEAHAAVEATAAEAAALPGVVGAVDPFKSGALSPDGRYGLVQVQFAASADGVPDRLLERYLQTGSAAEAVGIRVEHGGEVLQGEPEVGSTEALGVAVAAVVLVLTLGSLVAAGMTMLTALLGVGTGMAALFAVSALVDMTSTAPVLALMLGLAVGIDYSLFITSRYRQNVVEGLGPVEAVGRAVGTAGSAVVFAGATVVIALAGLSVVGIPFLTVMGLAAAGTVTVAVLVALTLLPSLLAFAGHRALPRRLRSRARPTGWSASPSASAGGAPSCATASSRSWRASPVSACWRSRPPTCGSPFRTPALRLAARTPGMPTTSSAKGSGPASTAVSRWSFRHPTPRPRRVSSVTSRRP